MQPVKSLNHVGIAVRSIDAQRPFYEDVLGAVFEGIEEVPDQKVRVGFFRVNDVRLELLEPTDPTSTVADVLGKTGRRPAPPGLHGRRYPGAYRRTQAAGLRMIDQTPRPGAHHTQIAFVHPKSSLWRADGTL